MALPVALLKIMARLKASYKKLGKKVPSEAELAEMAKKYSKKGRDAHIKAAKKRKAVTPVNPGEQLDMFQPRPAFPPPAPRPPRVAKQLDMFGDATGATGATSMLETAKGAARGAADKVTNVAKGAAGKVTKASAPLYKKAKDKAKAGVDYVKENPKKSLAGAALTVAPFAVGGGDSQKIERSDAGNVIVTLPAGDKRAETAAKFGSGEEAGGKIKFFMTPNEFERYKSETSV
jgi:hypothetical protein